MITSLSDSFWAAARGFIAGCFLQCWTTCVKGLCIIETNFFFISFDSIKKMWCN